METVEAELGTLRDRIRTIVNKINAKHVNFEKSKEPVRTHDIYSLCKLHSHVRMCNAFSNYRVVYTVQSWIVILMRCISWIFHPQKYKIESTN